MDTVGDWGEGGKTLTFTNWYAISKESVKYVMLAKLGIKMFGC